MRARILNAVLGAWLFASAFLWSHYPAEFHNTWITGAAMFLVALIGMRFRSARWVDAALALWLFCSIFFFPAADGGTVLNSILISMIVLIVSFLPLRVVSTPLTAWSVPPNPDV